MLKPNLRILWAMPVLSILVSGVLFQNGALAADESSTPSPTSIIPTPTRMPGITDFDRTLYSLDDPSSIWVVVNKKTPLDPIRYRPKSMVHPVLPGGGNPYDLKVSKVAATALIKMSKAMKSAGAGTLVLQSGFRSYASQVSVHNAQVNRFGLAKGEALAARPGFSEHQTGLAVDLTTTTQGCTIRVCFASTKAGRWLAKNAYKFGFILRYPDGATSITGYQFEPWHFRYVGTELSNEMRLNQIAVLEAFWHLPNAPKY